MPLGVGATARYGSGPRFTRAVAVAPRAGEEPMAPRSNRAVDRQLPSSDRQAKDSSNAQPRVLKGEPAQLPHHRMLLSEDRMEPARNVAANAPYLRTRRSAPRDKARGDESLPDQALPEGEACQETQTAGALLLFWPIPARTLALGTDEGALNLALSVAGARQPLVATAATSPEQHDHPQLRLLVFGPLRHRPTGYTKGIDQAYSSGIY